MGIDKIYSRLLLYGYEPKLYRSVYGDYLCYYTRFNCSKLFKIVVSVKSSGFGYNVSISSVKPFEVVCLKSLNFTVEVLNFLGLNREARWA